MIPKKEKIIAGAFSVAAGCLLAVIIRLNATLGEYVGVLESSFLVHAIGTLFAVPLVFAHRERLAPSKMMKLPKHLFLGGVIGVILVLLTNVIVPRLGMTLAVSLFIAANLFCGTVADHFGIFQLQMFRITARRAFGLTCAATGVLLLAW